MAAECRRASLADMPESFSESFLPGPLSLRQRQKAKAFSSGRYLDDVKLCRSGDMLVVNAKCWRSQRKTEKPHTLSIEIDKDTINVPTCSCKAGIVGSCAHILALVMSLQEWMLLGLKDIPEETSSTGRPQEWDIPRGRKICPEPASQMVICKPGKQNRKRRPVMAEFIDTRTEAAKPTNIANLNELGTPISYLTSGPHVMSDTKYGQVPLGSSLTYHEKFLNPITVPTETCSACGNLPFPKQAQIDVSNFDSNPWDHLILTQEQCTELERETTQQQSSTRWFQEREHRLTASRFGRILKRKAPITDLFLKSLLFPKQFSSAPTSYGICNEKIAKQMFLKSHPEAHLHPIGLVVNPNFGFLAATPDARVCIAQETAIVEIKCPYTARDMTIEEAHQHLPNFCLQLNDNNYTLKKSHEYWLQIQGQLMVTGAPYCVFIVYTRKIIHVENILPSEATMNDMFQKLYSFYVNHAREYINSNAMTTKM